MSEEKPLENLRGNFAKAGTVTWIGLRPARREPLTTVDHVEAIEGRGLEGDHAINRKVNSKRQVTLIQKEHLAAVGMMTGLGEIDPGKLRRNIVVEGINLQGLKEAQIRIGGALLEISGACHPCSRMEENLGEGGYSAMRGHGGWCCRVLESGEIKLGDSVQPV